MKTKFANLILCLTLVAVAISTCVIATAPAAAQSTPTYAVVRTMVIGGVVISMVLSLIITPAVHFFATGGREESATANGSQNGASTLTTPAQRT